MWVSLITITCVVAVIFFFAHCRFGFFSWMLQRVGNRRLGLGCSSSSAQRGWSGGHRCSTLHSPASHSSHRGFPQRRCRSMRSGWATGGLGIMSIIYYGYTVVLTYTEQNYILDYKCDCSLLVCIVVPSMMNQFLYNFSNILWNYYKMALSAVFMHCTISCSNKQNILNTNVSVNFSTQAVSEQAVKSVQKLLLLCIKPFRIGMGHNTIYAKLWFSSGYKCRIKWFVWHKYKSKYCLNEETFQICLTGCFFALTVWEDVWGENLFWYSISLSTSSLMLHVKSRLRWSGELDGQLVNPLAPFDPAESAFSGCLWCDSGEATSGEVLSKELNVLSWSSSTALLSENATKPTQKLCKTFNVQHVNCEKGYMGLAVAYITVMSSQMKNAVTFSAKQRKRTLMWKVCHVNTTCVHIHKKHAGILEIVLVCSLRISDNSYQLHICASNDADIRDMFRLNTPTSPILTFIYMMHL